MAVAAPGGQRVDGRSARGPAQEMGLRIEDGLIQALGKDIESYSAALQSGQRSGAVLPLLVAVMQRTEQVADWVNAAGAVANLVSPRAVNDAARHRGVELAQSAAGAQFIQRRMLLLLLHRYHLAEGRSTASSSTPSWRWS
ncbi:MAG: hypothetical protein U0787_06725 [Polyangia bacterium]